MNTCFVLQPLLVALTVASPHSSSPREAAPTRIMPAQASWQRTDTRHFEIHYLPPLARELERVGQAAERAYAKASGRLKFSLATRLPLIMFVPTGVVTREQVVSYATSEQVAPLHPHRSRIVLSLPEDDSQLDARLVHEVTHLLFGEIILPHAPGDGNVPRWVHEGIASYVAGEWTDEDERLVRGLRTSGKVPSLSQLTGDGGFTNPRLNNAVGYVAFDFIGSRWGPTGLRRFVDALIVPRVAKTFDTVFGLTPTEFDEAFRRYVDRRFR